MGQENYRLYPCPAGKKGVGDTTGTVISDFCEACVPGEFCDAGTTSAAGEFPPRACTPGHYCPSGIAEPTRVQITLSKF